PVAASQIGAPGIGRPLLSTTAMAMLGPSDGAEAKVTWSVAWTETRAAVSAGLVAATTASDAAGVRRPSVARPRPRTGSPWRSATARATERAQPATEPAGMDAPIIVRPRGRGSRLPPPTARAMERGHVTGKPAGADWPTIVRPQPRGSRLRAPTVR